MLSVSIVLIAIVGTINIANYISTNQALDARLSLIADNGGTFPDMTPGDFGKKLEPKSDQPPAMNDLQKHGISQESPFDTRYFTVTIAPDGTVESVDTGKIASISAGTAEEYAAELWKKGKKKGFFADYKYLATDSAGSTMYVFLNCQREISTIKTYVLASVGTGALGLVIVFVMIYFFSGKVLKPVSESYEKQKRFITDASHEIKNAAHDHRCQHRSHRDDGGGKRVDAEYEKTGCKTDFPHGKTGVSLPHGRGRNKAGKSVIFTFGCSA